MTRTQTQTPLILLGLNEVHFGLVRAYADRGLLPNFQKLFETTPEITTTSEAQYHELEPWIQWASVHTGKPLKDHKIFRLGDSVDSQNLQIWEHLEHTHGIKVGAVSPMNADNKCTDPAFFVPDPWTQTKPSKGFLVARLSKALSELVNKNATGGSNLTSYMWIGLGLLRYSLPFQGISLFQYIWRGLRSAYQRSILLDQLLTDIFITYWLKTRPDFSSLFLNGVAHLQHHYYFNAAPYDGPHTNPDWYMPQDRDPVLNGLRGYDKILGRMMALPDTPRILIVTGLRQKPVETPVYYWRLKDHATFLDRADISYHSVQPLMSRDFMIHFENADQTTQAEEKLRQITDQNGTPIFGELDNRGQSLFVSLIYPHDIPDGFRVQAQGREITDDFHAMVGFVAIKNGEHDGHGSLFDTANGTAAGTSIPVWDLFDVMDAHFGQNKTAQDDMHQEAA